MGRTYDNRVCDGAQHFFYEGNRESRRTTWSQAMSSSGLDAGRSLEYQTYFLTCPVVI
jgi:hypothetical protein